MATSFSTNKELESSLKVAYLYFAGMKQKDIAKQLRVTPSTVSRALMRARDFVEVRYNVPSDEELEAKLLLRFGLVEAIAVETGSPDLALAVVGQAAARYFITHVEEGDGVALSCGETLLEMMKAIPTHGQLCIDITQLSVEGDPEAIHQAPATLVGLLRSKVSPRSTAYGIQLPPSGTVKSDKVFRRELRNSPMLAMLRKQALSSRYVFIGVGAVTPKTGLAQSYLTLADNVTEGQFHKFVESLGLIGEVNNLLFDRAGKDRTSEIPYLSDRFINILSLQDLRQLARQGATVVAVATGAHKVEALRVVLESKIANAVITDRDMGLRLIQGWRSRAEKRHCK